MKDRVLISIIFLVSLVSLAAFVVFYFNGLGLSYNDARSHLNIGRRVVEGLKPGLAQIGSVWLPLNHLLMVPTIWNDFMWHSGLSGALQSMLSFVATSAIIYVFLKELRVGLLGRLAGVLIFVSNLNILYLQSTAMTELLLLATMTAGVYYLLLWAKNQDTLDIIKSGFWILLSTLLRYDGWFLLGFTVIIIGLLTFRKKGYQATEGVVILFLTLAGAGILGWFVWNQLIFKDALYFIFGPFSAHAQQKILQNAGKLETIGNPILSLQTYLYALFYCSNFIIAIIGLFGLVALCFDKKLKVEERVASFALTAPFFFNVLALILGFSVIFIQDISGNSWFNVRYGVMFIPSIAVFTGYLIDRAKSYRWLIVGLLLFVSLFGWTSLDAVTLDDARVGASQKNVTEVSSYLQAHASQEDGEILISAASHDAVIFSSGLPMKRFIHEGTGKYWQDAITFPDRWVKWIVMRPGDMTDLTYEKIHNQPGLANFRLVANYPFASVYERQWQIRSIDTTKYSRDLIQNTDLVTIDQQVAGIAQTGATYVAIGTPYDQEFLPALEAWVAAARKHDLKVWFRGNFSGWEGWFNYEKITPEEHTRLLTQFLTSHSNLVKSGDIFTPCPECENGAMGDPRQTGRLKEFRQFLIEEYNITKKFNVNPGYFSMNADVAKLVMDRQTTEALGGIVVIDHYVKTPRELILDVDFIATNSGGKIIIGEIGVPIPDIHGEMTPTQQAEWLDDALGLLVKNPSVIGINYWTGVGGSTAIWNTGGQPRLAVNVIAKYFR